MPPKRKTPVVGSPAAAEASNVTNNSVPSPKVPERNPSIVVEHAQPHDDPVAPESESNPASSPSLSFQHLLHICAYACAIFVVLRLDMLRSISEILLSPTNARAVDTFLPYAVCFFYAACVFGINYRSRSPVGAVSLTILSLLAAWLLCFPSAVATCYAVVLALKDRIRRDVPSSTPIFEAFDIVVYGAEGSQGSSENAKTDSASFNYMQCITKDSVVAAFVTFLFIIITVCTVLHKRKWIVAFMFSSLSYNVMFRITGINRFIASSSSDEACASVLCSGMEDPLKCVVGSDNLWTIQASEVVISVLSCLFCLYEPITHVFTGQLPDSVKKPLRLAYAATLSLVSVVLILRRVEFLQHMSDSFADPKLFLFFLRPVMYLFCLVSIEYGVSLCVLKKDSSVLQRYCKSIHQAYMLKLRQLNKFYVDNVVANPEQSASHQTVLKRSNTVLTYVAAVLIAMFLLVLNFIDPITGRGGIQHQILEAFWLDFDILIALSGPLTLLFVAVVYAAWLTNGFFSALRWANKSLNHKLVSILLRPKTVAEGKASISGTTLTVTGFAAESSMFEVGMSITGAGVSPSTWILERVSGKGGIGTYTVSVRQNVAETDIKGEFYLMNSVYTLMLQQFVIWWYWKDIMEFSEQMLVWLGADFDYLKGLRPIMIISVVIVFDSTFVFTKGLGHFVTIVDTIHKFSIRWIRSAIRSLHIVEEENTWMPGIIAKMIIVVFYLVVGFALLENFGWEMGTFKGLFAMTTLGPLFVATTENFRAQMNDTIQLLMRQDLRDACTHRKKVKLGDSDDRYRIVDLSSITLEKEGDNGLKSSVVLKAKDVADVQIEIEENPAEQNKESSNNDEDSDSDESHASSPSACDPPAASAAAPRRGAASAPAAVRADDIARDMGLHLQTMQQQMLLLQQKLDSLVSAAKKA